MSAYSWTYNGYTPSDFEGKAQLEISDSLLRFQQDFYVFADPTAATEALADASLNIRLAAMHAALAKDFQSFSYSLGTETLLSWSHSANTGFLTKARVKRANVPSDSDRGQRWTFILEAQREPQNSGRNGRRQARVSVGYQPDRLRTVTFSGTWTALDTPATALATYLAQITTWTDTWLGANQPLAPVTGAVWQLVGEPQVEPEDENKVLQFRLTYQETLYASTPGDTTKAVYTSLTITRADLPEFGAKLGLAGGAGEQSPTREPSQKTSEGAAGGKSAVTQPAPRAYFVQATVHVTNITQNVDTYWTATVRPWMDASLKAIFGASRIVWTSHTQAVSDATRRLVEVSGQVTVVAVGGLLSYRENLTRTNDRRLTASHVWSGKEDEYDFTRGGRELRVLHEVHQERADNPPQAPGFLAPPWNFEHEEYPQSARILDPTTGAVKAYTATHRRRYLFGRAVFRRAGHVALAPAPLGRQGGGGGSAGFTSVDKRAADIDGVFPLASG